MAYFEGEIPTVVSGGNNCGGFGGGFADGWWGIILIALNLNKPSIGLPMMLERH